MNGNTWMNRNEWINGNEWKNVWIYQINENK